MPNSTVTISLDPQTARAYEQVLDEVGRKAKAQGLTPETLDSILKGA